MFELFGITPDRNTIVENSNPFSPFKTEKVAKDFFFGLIPLMLQGRVVGIRVDDLKDFFDEVKSIPNDVSMVIEAYDKRANVQYTREDLLNMICKKHNIKILADNFRQRYDLAIQLK